MIYNNLYDEFLNLFPEDRDVFEQLEKETKVIKNEDGVYVMYDMVVVPYIKKIVDENPEKTKRAFAFFELMEKDADPEVGNVVEVSVLESLISDEDGFKKYIPFVGKETLKAARRIAQYFKANPF